MKVKVCYLCKLTYFFNLCIQVLSISLKNMALFYRANIPEKVARLFFTLLKHLYSLLTCKLSQSLSSEKIQNNRKQISLHDCRINIEQILKQNIKSRKQFKKESGLNIRSKSQCAFYNNSDSSNMAVAVALVY